MNCIEFRHICVTTPNSSNKDYLVHQKKCCSCTIFARETDELNHHLHEAVNVSPPPALAARILLRQSLSRDKFSRQNYYFSSALAACLLLVISSVFITLHKEEPALEQVITSYIKNNPHLPIKETEKNIQRIELEHLFASVNLKLNGNLGEVTFAKPCYIREQLSLHLTLAGDKGPVTVLIMPDSFINKAIKVNNTNLHGIIVPCPKGSMAILGAPKETLAQVETRFRNSITWNGV